MQQKRSLIFVLISTIVMAACSSVDEKPPAPDIEQPAGQSIDVATQQTTAVIADAAQPVSVFPWMDPVAGLAEPTWCPYPEAGETLTGEPVKKRPYDWWITKRDQISHGVHALGTKLDDMFDGKGKPLKLEENSTYLKLKLEDTHQESGHNFVDHSLKLRLDLPNTEKRLKLVFDSDPDDTESLGEKNVIQESNSSTLREQRDTSVGALRIVFNEVDNWRFSWDNGVRLNFPLEVFSRVRAKRRVQLTEDWSARFEQKVFWFKEAGYGETSELWFERKITDDYFLSLKTEMQWLEDTRFFEYSQALTTIHRLTDRDEMKYQVGVLGQSKPNPRVIMPYINTTYRRRVYEDWLFWHITPQVAFPRADDWKDFWSVTMGIEIIFQR